MGGGVTGLLVVLEGPDGVGKSTQARKLAAWVESTTHRTPLLVREPGGTVVGEAVRGLLLDSSLEMTARTEMLLFAAARAELVAGVAAPALKAGKVVILDRYILSSLAYQGYGGGVPLDEVAEVNRLATQGLRPDATVLLMGEGHPRPGAGDRVERRSAAFHARVRAGYHALAREVPGIRVVSGDAAEDVVHEAIVAIIQPLLESGEAPR